MRPEVVAALTRYNWPGNVRELSNAIERALVLSPDNQLHLEDLPEALLETQTGEEETATAFHGAVRQLKERLILDAVHDAEGNVSAAARILGLHPNYLHRLITNLELRSRLDSR